MGLGVPVVEVQNVAAARGVGAVALGIGAGGRTECVGEAAAALQLEGVVEGVTDLVAQQLEALGVRAPLHFQHLPALQAHQPRVREEEWQGHAHHAVRAEPFLRQPKARADTEIPPGKLCQHLLDGSFQPGSLEPNL